MEKLLGKKREEITNRNLPPIKSKETPQICQKCGGKSEIITIKNTGDLYVFFKKVPLINRHIPDMILFFSQYTLKHENILCKKCIYKVLNREENAKEEIIDLFDLIRKEKPKKEKHKTVISFDKKGLLNTHIENNNDNIQIHQNNIIKFNKKPPFLVSKGYLDSSSTIIQIPKTESENSELIEENSKNVEKAKKALNDIKLEISNMHYCNQIQKNTLISLFYSLEFFKEQVKNQFYINEYNKEVLLNNLTEEQRHNLNI